MARGDHIFSRRRLFGLGNGNHLLSITHHGIDMGDKSVIHFANPTTYQGFKHKKYNQIIRTSMREFAGENQDVYALNYDRLEIAVDSPDLVVERAESQLGNREYNLETNNCEHFAFWCKTGMSSSYQINRFKRDGLPLVLGTSLIRWYLPFFLPLLGYSQNYERISIDD